jgi:hypothetical protein
LEVNVLDVKPVLDALAPMMSFLVEIRNSSGEQATSCLLFSDVFIKVIEGGAPKELYWGTMQIPVASSVSVGQSVKLEGRLACTYDTDLTVSKYLSVLGDEMPLKLDFYGSYTYPSSPYCGHFGKIPKDYALPTSRWKKMILEYYRDILWIPVRKDTFEELKKIIEERHLHTPDEALKALLKEKAPKLTEK